MIEGYEMACKKTLEILPDCVCSSAKNLHDLDEATAMIRSAVMSKQYGNEDFLAKLIAQACGKAWSQEKFISNVQKFLWKFCDNLRAILIYYYFTVSIFPESGNFNVDNVRVCKILVSIKYYWI